MAGTTSKQFVLPLCVQLVAAIAGVSSLALLMRALCRPFVQDGELVNDEDEQEEES